MGRGMVLSHHWCGVNTNRQRDSRTDRLKHEVSSRTPDLDRTLLYYEGGLHVIGKIIRCRTKVAPLSAPRPLRRHGGLGTRAATVLSLAKLESELSLFCA